MTDEIDRIYQAPFDAFLTARNDLAKRVAQAEGKEAGAAIKALPKPSLSAWAANQLYWRFPKEFTAAITAADRVRRVQHDQLLGRPDAGLREALEAKEQAVKTLLDRLPLIERDHGASLSADMRDRTRRTLDALAAWGSADGRPRAGRLDKDVSPPGFEILSSGGPLPDLPAKPKPAKSAKGGGKAYRADEPPAPTVDPKRQEKIEKLERAAADAKGDLDAARVALKRAEFARAKADREQRAAAETLAEAEQQVKQARERAREADETLDAASGEVAGLTKLVKTAERTFQDAVARLDAAGD